jgi:hypothetical protein
MANASGVFINFDSLKEIKEKFKNLSEDAAKDVDAILQKSTESIVLLALQNLSGVDYNPNDYQKPLEKLYATTNDITDLKQSFRVIPQAINSYAIEVKMPYAAYVEFGTGGAVKIPAGVEDYAIQFKKRNPQNISMKANPYLFPALFQIKPQILQDIEDVLIN